MSGLKFDLPAAFLHHSLAIEYTDLVLVQIEVVQSRLEDLYVRGTFRDSKVVLRIDLVHFHHGVALVYSQFSIG